MSAAAFGWSTLDQAAALAEGWYLTTACTAANDVPVVGRVSNPRTVQISGQTPAPALPSAEVAWLMVMHGAQPLHGRARAALEQFNPQEFCRLREFASKHVLIEQRVVMDKVIA